MVMYVIYYCIILAFFQLFKTSGPILYATFLQVSKIIVNMILAYFIRYLFCK